MPAPIRTDRRNQPTVEAWACPTTVELARSMTFVVYAIDGKNATVTEFFGYDPVGARNMSVEAARAHYRDRIKAGFAIERQKHQGAHDEGYAAAARHGNDARNPYPPESPKHKAWLKGTAAYWGDEAEAEAILDAIA